MNIDTSNSLIGLGGRLRSGKDTVADYLVESYGYRKIGFSDALHEMLLVLNPTVNLSFTKSSYADLTTKLGYTGAKKIPEVRRLLQVLGTEVGRNMIDEDLWVNQAEKKIRASWDEGFPVVITGVRFPNELKMIRLLEGRSVWVSRPSVDAQTSAHSSENTLQSVYFNSVIQNSGSLDDLYENVDALLYQNNPELRKLDN